MVLDKRILLMHYVVSEKKDYIKRLTVVYFKGRVYFAEVYQAQEQRTGRSGVAEFSRNEVTCQIYSVCVCARACV